MLEAAFRFLEARQRSTAEVRRRLSTAGYRPELVDGAVARLVELEMLDDEAFARTWVESRDRAHPRGEHALRRELALKGIDRETASAALRDRATGEADGSEAPDDLAAAKLLERNARALARVADPRARRQRAYALLARHGFAPDVCRSAVARFVESAEGPASEADED